jgi:hypothetical protein
MLCCFRGGFTDKNGNKYNPNMVRLGSEEALSSAAAEVGANSNSCRSWYESPAVHLLRQAVLCAT